MVVWNWYEHRRLKLLADGLSGQVLDVGYAEWPNPFFGNTARVTGVDLIATDPVPGYAQQLVGDLRDCPELAEREFDALVAGEVIEHVEDPYGFLRSARDRLKIGGELRLSTPNPLGFPVIIYEVIRSRRRFFSDDHLFYFTPRWVLRMLQRSGFDHISLRAVGLWMPGVPLPLSPVSLSYQIIYSARRAA